MEYDPAYDVVERYKDSILTWFDTTDTNAKNIILLSQRLEKRMVIADLRVNTPTVEHIALNVINLLHLEDTINAKESKDLRKLIKSLDLRPKSKRHRSLPRELNKEFLTMRHSSFINRLSDIIA